MATEKQIAANRLNAAKSTGPKTAEGKRRSRLNAFRHGLTAETVITVFESANEYQSLERDLLAEYSPRTPLEHQLVVRLASLIWRLRRATAIETGLFEIESTKIDHLCKSRRQAERDDPLVALRQFCTVNESQNSRAASVSTYLAQTYLAMTQTNGNVLKRIGRYETALWRQIAQIILLLNSSRWPKNWS